MDSSALCRSRESPTLRPKDWRKDELQLKQPEGFPIIPLQSTLDRARKEVEARAEVVGYAGPTFEIFEDEDDRDNVTGGGDEIDAEGEDESDVEEDEVEDDDEEEEEEDDDDEGSEHEEKEHALENGDLEEVEKNCEHDAGNEEDGEHEYEDEIVHSDQAVAEKPLAIVDSRGRTRAAAKRLGIQLITSDQTAGPPSASGTGKESKKTGKHKRKRSITETSQQPRTRYWCEFSLPMRSRKLEF
ncbi:hypothetical protein GMOD_00006547 [Pyrenophora seminiperda CCB06]|uniref:Uncharacterized protein n=1 Tax=Pyrenophora seminiperda CCB06 TaxID=1302712 RepID=A0A3M7MAD0_9PLEO|nr:hypothetical protein GMOD_00006547 [Pyrenophora seminiperda CCB06]